MTSESRAAPALIVVGIICIICGIWVYRVAVRPLRYMDTTLGVITALEDCICHDKNRGRIPGVYYIYQYKYDGETYKIRDRSCDCPGDMEVGTELLFFVDPEKPGTVVPYENRRIRIIVILIFVLAGLFMVSYGGYVLYRDRSSGFQLQ